MSKLVCNCPKCKTQLRFDAGDSKQRKIVCPKCQFQFRIQVSGTPTASETTFPSSVSPTQAASKPSSSDRISPNSQPASQPLNDLLPKWSESLPSDSYHGNASFPAHTQRTKKTPFPFRKILIPALILFAGVSVLGLLIAGAMWGAPFLPKGTFRKLSSGLESNLLGSDSRSSVESDHQSVRAKIEEIGKTIPKGDQSESTAKQLRAELTKLDALFIRACKLPSEEKTLQEYAAAMAESRAMLERLRNQNQTPNSMGPNSPFPPTFWSVNTSTQPDELVTHAINELTVTSSNISSILSQALIDFPDPIAYTGTEFEWSEEDRRVLAIIRLQGSMERDALRVFASLDPKNPAASDLNKLHDIIDTTFEKVKELRKLPSKSVGGMIAFVPKGNPYESQQVSASLGLNSVRKLMQEDKTLPSELSFLFDEVKAAGDMIEGIIYGSRGGASAQLLTTSETSRGRYEAFVAAEEKKKKDALQAEIDRQEREKKKLAEAELRKQKAAEKDRQDEEDRKRALEERLANASSGKQGEGRFGPRQPGGPMGGMGRPGSRGGLPSDPPSGNMGNAPGQFPPNFPGFGRDGPGMSQGATQPPTAPQGDPAKMVTITAKQVKNGNSSDYLRDLPKWLLQYSPSVIVTNGDLKITVQNFDRPLSDLGPCFPMLVIESIDEKNRTIVAKEK